MTQATSTSKTIQPGNLVPGISQAAEFWSVSNTIEGAAAVTCDLVFALKGNYDETPAIAGTPMLTPGDGSATTKITAWYVKAQSATSITVTVEVDQAAGADKSNTVAMAAYIAGPQA